jgi:hypothetical protein
VFALPVSGAGFVEGVTTALSANLTQLSGINRTRGDIIRGGASAWEELPIGAAGLNLVSDGTDLVYSAAMAYTNVTGSRAFNTNYTNTGNRPLAVVVQTTYSGANANTSFLVGGVTFSQFSIGNGFTGLNFTHSVIVPPGVVYQVSKTAPAATIESWREGAL